MDSKQLIDSLTAHIALYHSSIPSSSPPPSNPRNPILRWFSSLSIPQRQSSLTVVDADFLRILLQMQSRLLRNGHGFFIVLSDLPSRSLPSLCFRRSRGLLSRAVVSNSSELSISNSIGIFASREGESAECSGSIDSLDSITVSEDLVRDVDRFVAVMDEVSDGGFLRGDESGAGLDAAWHELPWLKAKGYYSAQAFVVNKMELALRLAWLNCNGGKKRGAKSKEKAGIIAGVAANVFWRKKGCLDWWDGLDPEIRKKILRTVLVKAAKSLVNQIVKGAHHALKNESWFINIGAEPQLRNDSTFSCQTNVQPLLGPGADFSLGIMSASNSGKPSALANVCNGLNILQEISTVILACQHNEYEREKLFFSTLSSVHTISDLLFRRLRGLLMLVSNDCIKLELLEDKTLKAPQKKLKEKLGCRKGKNKGRNLNKSYSGQKSVGPLHKPLEEHGCGFSNSGGRGPKPGCLEENGNPLTVEACILDKDLQKETSSSKIEMEPAKGLDGCKTQISGKKNRKKINNGKNSNLRGPVATENPEANIMETTLPVTGESEPAKLNGIVDPSTVYHLPNAVSNNGKLSPNSSFCDATNEPGMEDGVDALENIQKHAVNGATVADCHSDAEHLQISNKLENGDSLNCGSLNPGKDEEFLQMERSSGPILINGGICYDRKTGSCISKNDSKDCISDSEATVPFIPVTKHDIVHRKSLCSNEAVSHPVTSLKLNNSVLKDENAQPQKESKEYHAHEKSSVLGSISYEWPNLPYAYFPSPNSRHVPAATDRLHLDVSHNWNNHVHQSYLSTRHQARNASMEGRIMPSQILPMSLDWPPMVRGASRLVPSMTCNYDSGFIPRLHSSFCSGFTAHGMQINGSKDDDDRKYTRDILDFSDLKNSSDLLDDSESHWMAEDESEVHAFSGRDYNKYFGGGIMYWNSSDPSGTSFSRPPSLSSEDSSWAWHEADLNRAIDDMVGLPVLSSSYSGNGLTSPPAGPFCSPFDQMGSGHQHVGYVMPGNDVSGNIVHPSSTGTDAVAEEKVSTNSPTGGVDAMGGDSFSYPMLRPIIVPKISRRGSGPEFKLSHDHKSPCVPPTRREAPRIKRPPSPVVLCVPRAPRPPPPSPIGEPRKQRGFPTVRSGSSSPRHWGMRSWYHDGISSEEARICVDTAEVVWPSWGNKGIASTPMIKPLPSSLLQDRLIAVSQLALDQEHPDIALPLQPPELMNCAARNMSLTMMQNLLHEEIDCFCKQVAAENLIKKPYINWAVKRVARSLQVLWPRSRTNIFGSNASGLALPTSDVDLVVCLPPVRNLEPIKEAGILEGRNGIKETCLQHAARYLANQEWVKSDSLKTIENTAIPVIMLAVEVPDEVIASSRNTSMAHTLQNESTQVTGEQSSIPHSDMAGLGDAPLPLCSMKKNDDGFDMKFVRLDISFKSPSHTGLQTTELVRGLTELFPAAIPLALVLKQFLADRNLDHSYSGGLSSYCLVLLITRFLQHEHHIGWPINQNLGSLLMDFFYFFGNVFDPRQMRISIQGSGVYVNRERGHSIDPIHIDDPLYPTNNVGRNCFRIHQCIKAFADAYSVLENELKCLPDNGEPSLKSSLRLLTKIIPSIDLVHEILSSKEPV